jgi:hypothetical protein
MEVPAGRLDYYWSKKAIGENQQGGKTLIDYFTFEFFRLVGSTEGRVVICCRCNKIIPGIRKLAEIVVSRIHHKQLQKAGKSFYAADVCYSLVIDKKSKLLLRSRCQATISIQTRVTVEFYAA